MLTELRKNVRQQQANENRAVLGVDVAIATGDVDYARYRAGILVRVLAVSHAYQKILSVFPGLKLEIEKNGQSEKN